MGRSATESTLGLEFLSSFWISSFNSIQRMVFSVGFVLYEVGEPPYSEVTLGYLSGSLPSSTLI